MFLKHYFNRSTPVYSLTQAQAHAGREIALLSYSLTPAMANAGREIASLSYSLTPAMANAGREIASLSSLKVCLPNAVQAGVPRANKKRIWIK